MGKVTYVKILDYYLGYS